MKVLVRWLLRNWVIASLSLAGIWVTMLFAQIFAVHWCFVEMPFPTAKISQGEGHMFKTRLPKNTAAQPWALRAAKVTEQGKDLPMVSNSIKEVIQLGQGRYRIKDREIWFSTSDRSSALNNGRVYALRIPWQPDRKVWSVSLGIAFVVLLLSLMLPGHRQSLATGVDALAKRLLSPGVSDGNRIAALDGIRGLAILLVIMVHCGRINPSVLADKLANKLITAGWCGVDLFFVLSGFLITGILLDSRRAPHFYRNFYARRSLRILPVYVAFLVIYCRILPSLTSFPVPVDYEKWPASLWLFLTNFAIVNHGSWETGPLAIFWTLAVEEQFYLVWPLVVRHFSDEVLKRVCLGMFVLAFVVRWWMSATLENPVIPIYMLTITRMDTLAAGAFVAIVLRQSKAAGQWVKLSRAIMGACGVIVLGLFVWLGHFQFKEPLVHTIGFSVLAVMFATIIFNVAQADTESILVRGLSVSWLRSLGHHSYAMYVCHMAVIADIVLVWFPPEQWPTLNGSVLPAQLWVYLLSLGVTLGFAKLSWYAIEKRFLALKRHFPSVTTTKLSR